MLEYLNGFGYLCQKAETTWSHVLLMSVPLQKYLTIFFFDGVQDGVNPKPWGPSLWLYKSVKSLVLTPSTVCGDPAKVKGTMSKKVTRIKMLNKEYFTAGWDGHGQHQ